MRSSVSGSATRRSWPVPLELLLLLRSEAPAALRAGPPGASWKLTTCVPCDERLERRRSAPDAIWIYATRGASGGRAQKPNRWCCALIVGRLKGRSLSIVLTRKQVRCVHPRCSAARCAERQALRGLCRKHAMQLRQGSSAWLTAGPRHNSALQQAVEHVRGLARSASSWGLSLVDRLVFCFATPTSVSNWLA